MKKKMLNQAFDDFAHALRRLLEADYNAHNGGLMFADRAEAVGNIESALTSVLNAFHSIYDILADEPGSPGKQWFNIGPMALVLAMRNARHHNKANKIRTLYTLHVQEARSPDRMEMYVFLDFPREGSTHGFTVFVSWSDLKMLLEMPEKQSSVKSGTRAAIEAYLASSEFSKYAEYYRENEDRLVFNAITVLTDAGISLMPYIRDQLEPLSTESDAFKTLFETSPLSERDKPDVNCGPFVLPE